MLWEEVQGGEQEQESQEMLLEEVRGGYSKIKRARRCYWRKSEEDIARSREPGDAF